MLWLCVRLRWQFYCVCCFLFERVVSAVCWCQYDNEHDILPIQFSCYTRNGRCVRIHISLHRNHNFLWTAKQYHDNKTEQIELNHRQAKHKSGFLLVYNYQRECHFLLRSPALYPHVCLSFIFLICAVEVFSFGSISTVLWRNKMCLCSARPRT